MHSEEAFFSIMQIMTDKGVSLVSKSLPVVNLNSVNRLFPVTKTNGYAYSGGTKFTSQYHII